jgi:hypothetical protein
MDASLFPRRGKLNTWLEKHPAARATGIVISSITQIATLVALVAAIVELSDRNAEHSARNWQLVTTPASGNSGKVEALEWLFENETKLVDLDLSCERMAGVRSDGKCRSLTYLGGLSLGSRGQNSKRLFSANLSGVDLKNCAFSNMDVRGEFTGALISNCSFVTSSVHMTGVKIDFSRGNSTKSEFTVEGQASFTESVLHLTSILAGKGSIIRIDQSVLPGSSISLDESNLIAIDIDNPKPPPSPARIYISLSNISNMKWKAFTKSEDEYESLLLRDPEYRRVNEVWNAVHVFDHNWYWKGDEPEIPYKPFRVGGVDKMYERRLLLQFFGPTLYECDPGPNSKRRHDFDEGLIGIVLPNPNKSDAVQLSRSSTRPTSFFACELLEAAR